MTLTKIDDRGLKTPIDLLDNEKIRLGTDVDLQLYSDNSNAVITAAGSGDLQLTSTNDDVVIQAQDNIFINPQGGEDGLKVYGDGGVKLYYANSLKFETTSSGAMVTGLLESEGNVSSTTQFSGYQGLRIQNANGAAHGVTADINFVAGTGSDNRGAVVGVQYTSTASGNDLYFATNPNAVASNDTPIERMRITSAGNVGIDETAPESKLTIQSTDRHVQQLMAENGVAAFTTSGTIYRQQYTSAGTSRRMGFFGIKRKGGSGDQTANFVMELCPDNSTNLGLASTATNTTAFTFTNTGMMEVRSGGGVRFHNYGDGTGIDSNLLDDYEEGTWTPGTQGFNNVSYTTQTGHYTKIGRLVYVDFYIRFASGTVGDANHIYVTNLPFDLGNLSETRGGGTSSFENIASSNDGGAGNISFYGAQNDDKFSTYIGETAWYAGDGVSQSGKYLIGTFIYHAA